MILFSLSPRRQNCALSTATPKRSIIVLSAEARADTIKMINGLEEEQAKQVYGEHCHNSHRVAQVGCEANKGKCSCAHREWSPISATSNGKLRLVDNVRRRLHVSVSNS